MKTLLKPKEIAFNELQEEIFKLYPRQEIVMAVAKLIVEVKHFADINLEYIDESIDSVLNKNETFNILMTLLELEKLSLDRPDMFSSMKDSTYNAHRTIAINICQMYGSGAISLFGLVDCKFRTFFPLKRPKSFLAKGIAALIASAASIVISGSVAQDYLEKNIELLESRGVNIDELVEMVFDMQKAYNTSLTLDIAKEHLYGVLRKEQTYHTIDLCIKIDQGVEDELFGEQFLNIVGKDEGLYGVDEAINTGISTMYGMIAITNFGYLDKKKPGIIGVLDSDHEGGRCNTFLDDTICAIVSAACARLAHNVIPENSKPIFN